MVFNFQNEYLLQTLRKLQLTLLLWVLTLTLTGKKIQTHSANSEPTFVAHTVVAEIMYTSLLGQSSLWLPNLCKSPKASIYEVNLCHRSSCRRRVFDIYYFWCMVLVLYLNEFYCWCCFSVWQKFNLLNISHIGIFVWLNLLCMYCLNRLYFVSIVGVLCLYWSHI